MSKYYLESRAMIFTPTELDELAYLLHANAHRGQCEKLGNPAQVEERKLLNSFGLDNYT